MKKYGITKKSLMAYSAVILLFVFSFSSCKGSRNSRCAECPEFTQQITPSVNESVDQEVFLENSYSPCS